MGEGFGNRIGAGYDGGMIRNRCRMGEKDLSSLVILLRRGSRHEVVVMAATFGLKVCPQRLLSWCFGSCWLLFY